MVIRYEDMRNRPLSVFSDAVRFIGLEYSEADVQEALSMCELKQLQEQERERGFREKPPGVPTFFRAGIVGEWQKRLSENQVSAIITRHGRVMKRMGYLDDENNPLVVPRAWNRETSQVSVEDALRGM
jgi:aryl sulfotransferase